METNLEPGKFYRNIKLGFFYKCISTDGDAITMMLLDSEQHGNRILVEFTIDIQQASEYELVEDGEEIFQLVKVYEKIKEENRK
jgi:hypothetical protein